MRTDGGSWSLTRWQVVIATALAALGVTAVVVATVLGKQLVPSEVAYDIAVVSYSRRLYPRPSRHTLATRRQLKRKRSRHSKKKREAIDARLRGIDSDVDDLIAQAGRLMPALH